MATVLFFEEFEDFTEELGDGISLVLLDPGRDELTETDGGLGLLLGGRSGLASGEECIGERSCVGESVGVRGRGVGSGDWWWMGERGMSSWSGDAGGDVEPGVGGLVGDGDIDRRLTNLLGAGESGGGVSFLREGGGVGDTDRDGERLAREYG